MWIKPTSNNFADVLKRNLIRKIVSHRLSFNYDAYDQHYRLENTTDNPLKAFERKLFPVLTCNIR